MYILLSDQSIIAVMGTQRVVLLRYRKRECGSTTNMGRDMKKFNYTTGTMLTYFQCKMSWILNVKAITISEVAGMRRICG